MTRAQRIEEAARALVDSWDEPRPSQPFVDALVAALASPPDEGGAPCDPGQSVTVHEREVDGGRTVTLTNNGNHRIFVRCEPPFREPEEEP